MRILIVDDDYVGRARLKAIFAKYGDCDAVPSGEIALEMFQNAHDEGVPYSIISMDVRMPGMSGQEVVVQIRNMERSMGIEGTGDEAKILMVSAMKDSENVVSSFVEGCQWYLVKPVTAEKLRNTLVKEGIIRN